MHHAQPQHTQRRCQVNAPNVSLLGCCIAYIRSICFIIKGQAAQEDKLPTYTMQHPKRAKALTALRCTPELTCFCVAVPLFIELAASALVLRSLERLSQLAPEILRLRFPDPHTGFESYSESKEQAITWLYFSSNRFTKSLINYCYTE